MFDVPPNTSNPETEKRGDTSGVMPEFNLTDEQAATYAELMGVEVEDVTPDTVKAFMDEQIEARESAEKEAEEAKESGKDFAESEIGQRLEAAEKEAAEAKERAEKSERRFFESDRDALIDGAIEECKIDPAKREDWQKRYEENPEMTREFIEELQPNEDLVKMFGGDDPPDPESAEGKTYADWAELSGVGAPADGEGQ
jgi:hypothetical protein